MRIAHVITRMIVGGAQENTLLNCRDLIEHFGDEVLLITGPERGPEGDLLSRGDCGVPVQYVESLGREIHPWRDYQAWRELHRAIKGFRPDVVHTHSAKAGILGRFIAWSQRVPAVIHTVHGAPFHPYQHVFTRSFYRMCERAAAARCHRLICVADAMTDLLVKAKVAPREKCITISSGMEVEPFLTAHEHRGVVRSSLGIAEQEVIVGVIARLSPLKGHDDLLLAARQLISQRPLVRFLLVGDGPLRSTLEKRIRDWKLDHHFIFAGLVPPHEIPRYLSATDFVVHTSLREGLARTLPQALLTGKPVVSYDIDGAREVCLTGETGVLIPPRDLLALIDAMRTLVDDTALREKLGRTGRDLVRERFDHRRTSARIREVYLEVLAQRGT